MATLDVVDLENKKVGTLDVHDDVFAAAVKRHVLTEVVHWQRAKRRRGTQSALTKSQVRATTKKPFKQKGTGRARQGDVKSPNMVGGGVAFAPKPRDYSYRMPKAKRRVALATALTLRQQEGGLTIVKDFDLEEIKTKRVVSALSALGKISALIVDGDNDRLQRSARNLPDSRYLHHDGINVYDVLRYPGLILTESAVRAIEKRLLGLSDDD